MRKNGQFVICLIPCGSEVIYANGVRVKSQTNRFIILLWHNLVINQLTHEHEYTDHIFFLGSFLRSPCTLLADVSPVTALQLQ